MITKYDDEVLKNRGVKEEYFLFCQLWKELTDNRTFDSYQFKSFNIINGIEELIHNISSYLRGEVPTTHSVTAVSEELIKAVKRDNVLAEKFTSIKPLLLNILGQNHVTHSELKALQYQLELYGKELKDKYDNALIDVLADSANRNDYSSTVALTSCFISRCIDIGWSSRALFTKLDSFEGNDLKNFLKKIFNYPQQTYVILFPFRQVEATQKGKTKEESKNYVKEELNKFNISVESQKDLILQYTGIDNALLKENEYIAVVTCGKDIYSVSHSAIVTLSNALNILSFFSSIEPWSLKNKTWVVFNTESPYTASLKPIDIYRTYEYLDSSSTVYNRIQKVIHDESCRDELYQKLISSFSYTNLSHASMTVEEKYMNMWIALESLTRTDAHDGIINNIVQCIPNACSLRYIYRLIRNFSEDCGRCNISLDFESIKIDLQDNNKEQIVSQMLTILRTENLAEILLERCKSCKLLYYRCQEIQKTVIDENSFALYIKSHHKTIEWHLDRLYRIRNEIAHSALFQHVSTVRYTEHLYDYLATYISEIVRFAVKKDIFSFGVLSAAINDNYKSFEFIANEKKIKEKKSFWGNLWSSGIMDFI